MIQRLDTIENTLESLVRRDDFIEFKGEMKESMNKLSDEVKALNEEANSIVQEAPDKFQTRVQCAQNMNTFTNRLSSTDDEIKYIRGRMDYLIDFITSGK